MTPVRGARITSKNDGSVTELESRGLGGSLSAIALRKAPSEAGLPDTPAQPGPAMSMNQVLWSHPTVCVSF